MNDKPNILVVDDIKENTALLVAVIKKIECNVITATSGLIALEKTQGVTLALALIDVRMPGMNGYEFAVKLNEVRQGDKVPVIFVTANYFDEKELAKGYDIGAVDYILKPIDSHILLCKISVFLDLFNQKQSLVISEEKYRISNKELQKSLAQLHKLTQYIEKVRENERLAIARELHDDLGQSLTSVKIDLGIIRQKISNKEVGFKIEKVSGFVGEIIKTVQRLTSQLRPQIMDDLGLEVAIEWYTKEYAQRTGIEVFLDLNLGIITTPDMSLVMFRIMQESLTNITRHSRATHVDIGLWLSDDHIHFRVSDNGIGINKSEIRSKKSFGLLSMKERAASLGGTFDISRENDCETVIKVVLPLNFDESYENPDL